MKVAFELNGHYTLPFTGEWRVEDQGGGSSPLEEKYQGSSVDYCEEFVFEADTLDECFLEAETLAEEWLLGAYLFSTEDCSVIQDAFDETSAVFARFVSKETESDRRRNSDGEWEWV